MLQKLQSVLLFTENNFFGRLKDAFHTHLVNAGAGVRSKHCEEVRSSTFDNADYRAKRVSSQDYESLFIL